VLTRKVPSHAGTWAAMPVPLTVELEAHPDNRVRCRPMVQWPLTVGHRELLSDLATLIARDGAWRSSTDRL